MRTMTRAKSKLPKFTGELAKPIKQQRLTVLASQEEREAAIANVFMQRTEKIGDLLRFYGLSREKWGQATPGELFNVIFKMGCDFIPGFQTDNGVGRPSKHDAESQRGLLTLIDFIRKRGLAGSDLKACEVWADCEGHKGSALAKRVKTLANLVSRARASKARQAARAIN